MTLTIQPKSLKSVDHRVEVKTHMNTGLKGKQIIVTSTTTPSGKQKRKDSKTLVPKKRKMSENTSLKTTFQSKKAKSHTRKANRTPTNLQKTT